MSTIVSASSTRAPQAASTTNQPIRTRVTATSNYGDLFDHEKAVRARRVWKDETEAPARALQLAEKKETSTFATVLTLLEQKAASSTSQEASQSTSRPQPNKELVDALRETFLAEEGKIATDLHAKDEAIKELQKDSKQLGYREALESLQKQKNALYKNAVVALKTQAGWGESVEETAAQSLLQAVKDLQGAINSKQNAQAQVFTAKKSLWKERIPKEIVSALGLIGNAGWQIKNNRVADIRRLFSR